MSYQPIALVVPIIYVALQFIALSEFRDRWRQAAVVPVAIMSGIFALHVLSASLMPVASALLPLAGMTLASVYLTLLILLHDHRKSGDLRRDEAVLGSENVVNISDYRTGGTA